MRKISPNIGLPVLVFLALGFVLTIIFSQKIIRHKATSEDSHSQSSSELVWLEDLKTADKMAKTQDKTIMIDFYADWCEPCKRFEEITFKDLAIQKELNKLVLLRIDLNSIEPWEEELSNKYNILGLPTILFVNSEGLELEGTRIEGFLNPNELLLHLNLKVFSKLG